MKRKKSVGARKSPSRTDTRLVELPETAPLLFLVSEVVFPFGASLVRIRTPRNLALLAAQEDRETPIAVAFVPGEDPEEVGPQHIGKVGVAARVIGRLHLPDGTEQITLQGLARIYLTDVQDDPPHMTARTACVVERRPDASAVAPAVTKILAMVEELAARGAGLQQEHVLVLRSNTGEPGHFADLVAAILPLETRQRARVVDLVDVGERLEYVVGALRMQVEAARVLGELDAKVQQDIAKSQREYYLRRQLKLLREELGEKGREEQAADEAEARMATLELPAAVTDAARIEVSRMRDTNPDSAEFAVIRNHLDWLLGMPWGISTHGDLDLERVRKALDADHYGLDRPKQRILEHLAVMKLSPRGRSPVLCFLGPPGTGKTSLAQSIARALGRKLVRISVGGVRDEAEIRGHRRTYVGAMPGKIVQALRKVGCEDPLMVVDEIDKMTGGYQGDPRSAMLEVLDPEQNHAFVDHFMEVPTDLSRIFFVTTANVLWDIPEPLRDRMEIIELSSYVAEEKIEIARRHLVPLAAARMGLPKSLRLDKAALRTLVSGYTAEAGVRELGRQVESIFRKLALEKAVTGRSPPRTVRRADVLRLLGPPEIPEEPRRKGDEVGVVNGLAWTSAGGDVLLIEVVRMPGSGEFQVTGSIGDVMRESVAAALTYVRSHAGDLGIRHEEFAKHDVHIHFPEGAVPKDGPSAGVAVVTALASIFTGLPVRSDVAMTGEINLRGGVLPVGGLQEKLSAAARLGMKRVFVPAANTGELARVRPSVRTRVDVVPVDDVAVVLAGALRRRAPAGRGRSRKRK